VALARRLTEYLIFLGGVSSSGFFLFVQFVSRFLNFVIVQDYGTRYLSCHLNIGFAVRLYPLPRTCRLASPSPLDVSTRLSFSNFLQPSDKDIEGCQAINDPTLYARKYFPFRLLMIYGIAIEFQFFYIFMFRLRGIKVRSYIKYVGSTIPDQV
jgi:hypothetical protein